MQIVDSPDQSGIAAINVTYTNYSDDGLHIINGPENVVAGGGDAGTVTFNENLSVSGSDSGSKTTTPGGFTLTPATSIENRFAAVGLMTTALDGVSYSPPLLAS